MLVLVVHWRDDRIFNSASFQITNTHALVHSYLARAARYTEVPIPGAVLSSYLK